MGLNDLNAWIGVIIGVLGFGGYILRLYTRITILEEKVKTNAAEIAELKITSGTEIQSLKTTLNTINIQLTHIEKQLSFIEGGFKILLKNKNDT